MGGGADYMGAVECAPALMDVVRSKFSMVAFANGMQPRATTAQCRGLRGCVHLKLPRSASSSHSLNFYRNV